jgi:hypothetical protein
MSGLAGQMRAVTPGSTIIMTVAAHLPCQTSLSVGRRPVTRYPQTRRTSASATYAIVSLTNLNSLRLAKLILHCRIRLS